MKTNERKPAADPRRILDRSQNMDRSLDQDPRQFTGQDPAENDSGQPTERERRDGIRPEDQENARENELERRRDNDPDYAKGEDRKIHPEFDEDNRDYPLEDPIDSPNKPL